VRLAYPECSLKVRENIACAQFISALTVLLNAPARRDKFFKSGRALLKEERRNKSYSKK